MIISAVINTNHGIFSLSAAVAEAVLVKKGISYRMEKASYEDASYPYIGDGWKSAIDVCKRHDPDLIAVIREIGVKAAGSPGCVLKIIDFEVGGEIEENGGRETARVRGSEIHS